MPTLIFHDSMLQPKFLDTSSVDWVYPIEQSVLLNHDTREFRHRVYRSRRIKLPDWISNQGATDLSIYLHNAGDAVSNCVRVYAWKTTFIPFDPLLDNAVSYVRVGFEDFFDFTPITYNPNTNVAMFSLKVADVWSDMQLVVSQPCIAVSVYANNLDSSYPAGYLKMTGSLATLVDDELPLRDAFDGTNTDWTTP